MRTQHLARNASRLLAAAFTTAIVGSSAHAITPTQFTANNPLGGAPIGWTFAGNKFVGTILGDGTGRMYSTDLGGGNIQPFGGAVNLPATYGQEHYVTASLGLGSFPTGDIYVAAGNNIKHITNAARADPGLFVTGSLGGFNGDVRGIMFDPFGTFGYQMIVTTQTGFVYTVDSAGSPTQIASLGEDVEGLDIAPPGGTWGAFNGWLFVASEGSGTIRAIKPGAFTVQPIANVGSAEQLSFVPLNLGLSGNPLEGLYSANYPNHVLHASAGQFAGMQGDLIVTGEITDLITRVSFDGIGSGLNSPAGIFNTDPLVNQPEDGLFVTADMLAQLNVPEPASLSLLTVGAGALLRRRK